MESSYDFIVAFLGVTKIVFPNRKPTLSILIQTKNSMNNVIHFKDLMLPFLLLKEIMLKHLSVF